MTHMGKITGFLEIEREDRATSGRLTASATTANSSSRRAKRRSCAKPPAAWIAAFPIVIPAVRSTTRSPTGTIEYPDWAVAAANLHSTNNFPEVTDLPRALRGRLHAEHHRRADHHLDRMRDRRQGLRRGLGRAVAAGIEDRQARGRRRLRSRRPCRGPALRPGRPRRACLREVRLSRRPAPHGSRISIWRNTSSSAG